METLLKETSKMLADVPISSDSLASQELIGGTRSGSSNWDFSKG